MSKAMVISLGTGKNVENGIAKSIDAHNPDFIIFVASEQSKDTVLRVERVLGRKLENYELVMLEDENDIEECYSKSREAVSLLKSKGYSANQISIDFTSGTKAMSAGVCLTAMSIESDLIYVAGKRDPETGRVITGTERVITFTPSEIIADSKKKLAIEMFNRYQFDACLEIIKDMKAQIHDEGIIRDFLMIEKLALAYSAWDKFNHAEAMKHLKEAEDAMLRKWGIKANVGRNKELLYRVINCEKYCPEHVADLLQNARRRAKEGKVDDAIARLYRTIELIAQYQLFSRYGIDTSDVDVEKLPENLQEKYERQRNKEGKIALALRGSYELLEEMGDELGRAFRESNELLKILNARNHSILAHGIKSLDKECFEKLFEITHTFASSIIKNVEELESKAYFPILGGKWI